MGPKEMQNELSTELNEIKASSASAIRGDIEKIKSLSVRRLDTDEVLSTKGRESWCLAQLIVTGQRASLPLNGPPQEFRLCVLASQARPARAND